MFSSKNFFLCGGVPPEITYVTFIDDATAQTTYTFTNASIGAPGLIVVAYHAEVSSATARTFVSATIDGNAATSVATIAQNGVTSTTTGLISRRITSGSTATVSITMSGACLRARIAIWRINNNISDTAFTTSTAGAATGTGLSITLNSVPANAVGMAAQTNGTNDTPLTWTNATERYDSVIGSGATTQASGADFVTTASGNITITTSHASSAQATSLAAAVWS
jgi:hypothetical protein